MYCITSTETAPSAALDVLVSFPDPIPTGGRGSGILRAISWASRMQNSHVILIIVMATHCLVCGSRRCRVQISAGRACNNTVASFAPLVRCHIKKSHAVNLIGAPEIRTATSSSPRNRSKYTRPSSPCRGGVWDRDYGCIASPAPRAGDAIHPALRRERSGSRD